MAEPHGPISPTNLGTITRTHSRKRRTGMPQTMVEETVSETGDDGQEIEIEGRHHPSLSFSEMVDDSNYGDAPDGAYEEPTMNTEESRKNWRKTFCCNDPQPLKVYWNTWPTILLIFYCATTGFYLFTRATKTIPQGSIYLEIFAWFVFGVEAFGVTSMLPYALLLIVSQKPKKTAKGLPAAGTQRPDVEEQTYYHFVVRVLVPCYKEDLAVVSATVKGAMDAALPKGTRRFVYLCDDGGDDQKKEFMQTLGEGAVYVTGRKKIKGDINGKSSNLNNCLQNVIYARYKDDDDVVQWDLIPLNELIVVFDADMVAKPDFFLRMLEVMTDPDKALCLSPQGFHNVNPNSDLFNNSNLQFWEYWLPGAVAWGYIACTGTNFCIRASPLAHAGFFPTYTITEDYALGMELKKLGYKGSYLLAYIAEGEAPEEVRNVMRQRSRWCKGHMQVFFSWKLSPLTQWRLGPSMKLWYSYGTWTYIVNIVTTPTFLLVPFLSLAFGINCVILNKSFALSATLYYGSILLIQNYVNKLSHLKAMFWASVSNTVLWFTYTKAVINVLLSLVDLKGGVAFKVTTKAVTTDGPVATVKRTLSKMARTVSQRLSGRYAGYSRTISMAERGNYTAYSGPISGALDQSGELKDNNVRVRGSEARNLPVRLTVVVNSGEKKETAPLLPPPAKPKVSWWARMKSVFSPKNVGDLGGVLDPVALVTLLAFCLAVIGIGIWRLVTVNPASNVGVPSGLPSPYITIPMLWAITNAVAPYLFIHYCFTNGGSFRFTANLLRLVSTLATIGAVALLWASLPILVDVRQSARLASGFMASQANLASRTADFALVNGQRVDMKGGLFVGGDPVKYAMPMASTVTVLSWALLDFPQGFDGQLKAETLQTIRQGAEYLMKSYQGGNASNPTFIAQVGDPKPYILPPVDTDADKRVWSLMSQDPNMEAANSAGREAFVLDKDKVGVDVLGSTAAALAASSLVLAREGEEKLALSLYATAEKVFAFAESARGREQSFCDIYPSQCQVNATWRVKAPALIVNSDLLNDTDKACWVPDYDYRTCIFKTDKLECQQEGQRKRVFLRRPACCSFMQSEKVWANQTTAQGACALPDNQMNCWIPNRVLRTCEERQINPKTGLGCAGDGLDVFDSSLECCQTLQQYQVVTAENPGTGVCAVNFTSCFVIDKVQRTCKQFNGSQCTRIGYASLTPDLFTCCNNLVTQIGENNLTGGCESTTVNGRAKNINPGGRALLAEPRMSKLPAGQDARLPFDPFLDLQAMLGSKRTTVDTKMTGDFELFKSRSIYDDMAWGATWLFRGAADPSARRRYAGNVQYYVQQHKLVEVDTRLQANESYYHFNWDNSIWGVAAVMAKLTDDVNYHRMIRTFLSTWILQKPPPRSPELERELRRNGEAFRVDNMDRDPPTLPATEPGKTVLLLTTCIPDRNTSKAAMAAVTAQQNESAALGIHFTDPGAVTFESDKDGKCDDGIDNDCDGLIDMDDPDCPFFPARSTRYGLAWSKDHQLPNAAAAAFLGMYYSSYVTSSNVTSLSNIERHQLNCWGQQQLSYMLGINEHEYSYLVGYGKRYPKRLRHRESSCAADQTDCNFISGFYTSEPNPRMDLVRGALVSGPDLNDRYDDNRENPGSEVGIHHNAPFLAAAAGLLHNGINQDACGQQTGAFQDIFYNLDLNPQDTSS